MTGFGERWAAHVERIRANWIATVAPDDVVLVPGDISWRKTLREAVQDLEWLDALPGRHKVLVKGNHDWWWSRAEKVRAALPPSLAAVDADAQLLEAGVIVAGSKGFVAPPDPYFGESDRKAFVRNLRRVQEALGAAELLKREAPEAPVIVLIHYPPFTSDGKPTEFSQAIEAAGFVDHCVFGHFHFEEEWKACPQGPHNGVTYWLGSADYLQFAPIEILTLSHQPT